MWEEILKRRSSAESRTYYRNVFYNVMSNYIVENYESGAVITIPEISNKLNEVKELCLEVISEERGKRIRGPFLKWFGSRVEYQIRAVLNKMIRLGLMEPGGERRMDTENVKDSTVSSEYRLTSRDGERATTYILKGWQPGPKPKKLTPEMEKDIENVIADDEFAVSDKLSDKIKHILMETPEGKQPKTKEDIKEFNRRFPGIKTNIVIEDDDDDDDVEQMDTGCGCGCSGEKVKKAKVPAVRNAEYNTYVKFIKRVLKDEGGAAGMQNFIDAGNKFKGFKERTLRYVISDAIDHDNWLAEHEFGDYYLYEGTV